jgi:hypothetical protein
MEFPFDLAELLNADGVVDAGVRQVATKHGGVLSEGRQAEEERGGQASDFHFWIDEGSWIKSLPGGAVASRCNRLI